MKKKIILLVSCSVLSLMMGCAGRSEKSLSLFNTSPAASVAPDVIGPGVVLEIAFYRNSVLEDKPYRISPGDQLKINVYKNPELSLEEESVLPDGNISLPLIGIVKAAGKDNISLTQEIAALYQAENIRDPHVSISIKTNDMRLNSLLSSSGSSDSGSSSMQILVDSDGVVDLPFIPIVYVTGKRLQEVQQEIIGHYKKEFDGKVEAVVNLKSRPANFAYVIGEVVNPGPIRFVSPMNPFTAVAASGGFLNTANRSDLRLYRFDGDKQVQGWRVNLVNEFNGAKEATTFQMHPYDVIYVPKSGVAIANEVVEKYIRNMIPVSVGFGLSYTLNENNN